MKKIIVILCILFTFYLAFYQLGKAPLENWDEAWYAEVTKQILQKHDFIILNWNREVWLEKPPMYMWLSALTASVLGLSEFSARFISAVSGFFIILLVFISSYRWYGLIPSLLALSTLALNNVFVWRMRSGNIDVFVTLLIVLTYFLLIGNYKYKYPLLGVLFACIYLTKASLVFFPLLVFVVYELFVKRKKILQYYKEYILLFLLFFLISGIWLFLGYQKVGSDFVNYALFQSDQGAANIHLTHLNFDYLQHMYYALQRRFFFVLLIGTAFALFAFKKEKKLLLLLLFSFILFFELSFTTKNNNWYLIPSMPFWSLLIAYGTYRIIKLFRNNKVIIGIIILLSAYVSYKTFTVNITPILASEGPKEQAQSARALIPLTAKDDIVIRLDHLYPTTIYYSNRKVIASPSESNTGAHFISRKDLDAKINGRRIFWLVGTTGDVESFLQTTQTDPKTTQFIIIRVNSTESIISVKQ